MFGTRVDAAWSGLSHLLISLLAASLFLFFMYVGNKLTLLLCFGITHLAETDYEFSGGFDL